MPTKQAPRVGDHEQESFGTFELLAGTHTQGYVKSGTRTTYHGRNPGKGRNNGDILTARSEKEAKFFRKYPDKFRELFEGMRGVSDKFGEVSIPSRAPRPTRPPHATDLKEANESDIAALPGEGVDNDGAGDDGGEHSPQEHQSKRKEFQKKQKEVNEETEEVDADQLRAMTVRELVAWSNERNIDLKGAVKKEDILKRIEESASE